MITSAAPAAATLSPLYTVPTGKTFTGRIVCTCTGADTTVRVSVAPGGAADEPKQYVLYDSELLAGGSIATAPLDLDAGDVVRVRSVSGAVNFHLTGILT